MVVPGFPARRSLIGHLAPAFLMDLPVGLGADAEISAEAILCKGPSMQLTMGVKSLSTLGMQLVSVVFGPHILDPTVGPFFYPRLPPAMTAQVLTLFSARCLRII